jgi:hypothetical protein
MVVIDHLSGDITARVSRPVRTRSSWSVREYWEVPVPLAKNLCVSSLGPRKPTALAAGGFFAAPTAVNALLGPLARSAPTVPANRNQARAPAKDEGDSLRHTGSGGKRNAAVRKPPTAVGEHTP